MKRVFHIKFTPDTLSLSMEGMEWSETPFKSEILAAEALARDLDRWIVYRQVDQPYEHFEDWLEKNLPSRHKSSEGVGWISVKGKQFDTAKPLGDLERLHQMWDEVQRSNRPINVDLISDLARMCNVTTGKWMFHVDTGGKGDYLWSMVARAIVKGRVPSFTAKVSPVDDEDEDNFQHVVCIYNPNYLDEEEVLQCENGLRRIGIKCPLYFKPDVFTYLGIYRNNPWELRPTIYRSEYDILTGQSKIDFTNAPGRR